MHVVIDYFLCLVIAVLMHEIDFEGRCLYLETEKC